MSGTNIVDDPPEQSAAAAPLGPEPDIAPAPPLGMIGLSSPARPVALALYKAGLHPLACDPDPAHRQAYRDAAGSAAPLTDDPAEIASRCTLVVLFQPLGADAATIHAVLADRLAPGSLIIDMSPALPSTIRHLAAELAAHGLRLIDAPTLPTHPSIVLAGGSLADLAFARPILDTLGTVVPTGPVGSAQALSALLAELDVQPDLDRIRALAAAQA